MRIFLTGATGFIGSHLLEDALELGLGVTALRRTVTSQTRYRTRHAPTWVDKDLNDVCVEDFEDTSCLVHLACAGVSPQVCSLEEMIDVNIVQLFEMLKVALAAGVKRWVVCGTFAEYGLSCARYDKIPVDAPLEPVSGYAATKVASYNMMKALAIENGVSLSYCRLFSVFGEGQFHGNLWPSLKRAAEDGRDYDMTLGEQVRDFIFVKDVTKLLLRECSDESSIPGHCKTQNFGSGNPMSVADFCKTWWQRWNAQGELRLGAIPYRKNELMRCVPLLNIPIISSY